MDDSGCLRQYAENHSDEAFAVLVTRHVNLVYSVALRQTGNAHEAEEITQAVFIILAQKAAHLRHEKALSSWLFQATHLTSANFVRGKIRRQNREQEAAMQTISEPSSDTVWPQIAPLLETAVAGLRESDRRAILLRFYEGWNLREVGLALGASEATAEKRVSRALEKLRQFFAKRGVSSTTAILARAISANSVQAAPVTLATSVTAAALAKGAVVGGSTLTLIQGALKLMAWTQAKTAVVSIMVAVLAATAIVQHQAQIKLRGQNESLQRQLDQLAQLAAQNQNLSNLLADANRSAALAQNQLREDLRPRAPKPASQPVAVSAQPDYSSASPTAKTGTTVLPKNIWTNVGFGTPQMALQTRGWAVLNGDRDRFRQSLCLTDDARKLAEDTLVQMAKASTDPNKAQYIKQVVDNQYGVEEAILLPLMAANQSQSFTGYTILSQQSPSAYAMTLEVETDRANAPATTETLNFQRFGDDWKVVIDRNTMQKMMNP